MGTIIFELVLSCGQHDDIVVSNLELVLTTEKLVPPDSSLSRSASEILQIVLWLQHFVSSEFLVAASILQYINKSVPNLGCKIKNCPTFIVVLRERGPSNLIENWLIK